MKSTKKSKTKELEQTAVLEETLPVVPNDPVVERLDKIIELLTLIAKDNCNKKAVERTVFSCKEIEVNSVTILARIVHF